MMAQKWGPKHVVNLNEFKKSKQYWLCFDLLKLTDYFYVLII